MRFGLLLLLLNLAGVDQDRDSIPDSEEQYLLERFLPRFHLAVGDCDVKPAEFERGKATPVVKERKGTIYGQVFPVEGGVEIHYFHLWANDCGHIPHVLDAEHVSAFVVQQDKEWQVRYWYSAAHEDTVCDRGAAARAHVLLAEWGGGQMFLGFARQACLVPERRSLPVGLWVRQMRSQRKAGGKTDREFGGENEIFEWISMGRRIWVGVGRKDGERFPVGFEEAIG